MPHEAVAPDIIYKGIREKHLLVANVWTLDFRFQIY